MYCKDCGKEIDDNAAMCTYCNAIQVSDEYQASQNVQTKYQQDQGGIGYGLLGCCVPIVGLILFLVWRDEKPKSAKSAGIGALVSVILGVIYYVISFAITFIISMSASDGLIM